MSNFHKRDPVIFLSVAETYRSPKRNQLLSPKDNEEKRLLLKSLITPKVKSKRSKSAASTFDDMIIKAAKSAENLPVKAAASAASASYAAETGGGNNFRKESTVSLQGLCRFRFIKIL